MLKTARCRVQQKLFAYEAAKKKQKNLFQGFLNQQF